MHTIIAAHPRLPALSLSHSLLLYNGRKISSFFFLLVGGTIAVITYNMRELLLTTLVFHIQLFIQNVQLNE